MWARVPGRTLLVSVHFALLGEEIAAFALGSGVCAGVGLGEVLFHPTWFHLFVTVLLTRLNDIVPYIYIHTKLIYNMYIHQLYRESTNLVSSEETHASDW